MSRSLPPGLGYERTAQSWGLPSRHPTRKHPWCRRARTALTDKRLDAWNPYGYVKNVIVPVTPTAAELVRHMLAPGGTKIAGPLYTNPDPATMLIGTVGLPMKFTVPVPHVPPEPYNRF